MLPSQEVFISPEDLPVPRRSKGRRTATERLETRRQMHLSCEHRRRNAIQTGITNLRELLEEDRPPVNMPAHHLAKRVPTSRVEVLLSSVRKIEELQKTLAVLEKEYLVLSAENTHLKRVGMLPPAPIYQDEVPKPNPANDTGKVYANNRSG